MQICTMTEKKIYVYVYMQWWSELLSPLVNIIVIFYLKTFQKSNLSLENKNLKWEEIS